MKDYTNLFESEQFGIIRTNGTPDNPEFCLSDVCKALKLDSSAVMRRLPDGVISVHPTVDALGRTQPNKYVNESGLYDVILDSKKPEAKAFRQWITSDVLPCIRKNGVYATDNFIERSIADPKWGIKVLQALHEERERNKALTHENETKQALLEEQKPKVLFADAVATAKQSCLVGELAKIICQNGYKIGEKRLFAWMRANHYLGTSGEYYNSPCQKYIEMGLFEVKKNTIVKPNGSVLVKSTTKVTGKGQQYFINKFLGGK